VRADVNKASLFVGTGKPVLEWVTRGNTISNLNFRIRVTCEVWRLLAFWTLSGMQSLRMEQCHYRKHAFIRHSVMESGVWCKPRNMHFALSGDVTRRW